MKIYHLRFLPFNPMENSTSNLYKIDINRNNNCLQQTMKNRRCFSIDKKCRRCTQNINLSNPRNDIFCFNHGGHEHRHICNHRIDHLRCHGIRKDGLRCQLIFNMITGQNNRTFFTKQYCFLHV